MRAALFACLVLTACGNTEPDGWVYDQIPIDAPNVTVCHFPSGRPCRADTICMSPRGNECNYGACLPDGSIVGTAIGCQAGTTDPLPGGPFNCDPATVIREPTEGGITPPQGGCFLGALRVIDPSRPTFPFGECVPISQCLPIACDPQFDGDGCPSGYGCDAASRTCVAQ